MGNEENQKDYRKLFAKKSHVASIVSNVARTYETLREESFVQWIDDNPEYWKALTEYNQEDIGKEFAVEVMDSLIKSHIIELQMIWLTKCSHVLDIFGNTIEED